MSKVILYGTLGCHLCEEAKTLLFDWFGEGAKSIEYLDIAVSENMVEQYGVRIPVLSDGQLEVDWPFEYHAVCSLMYQYLT